MKTEPVVRLRAVRHRYGSVTALDGVSVEIGRGRLAGLLGPDGVGKSTLLALAAGVRAAQAGEVETLGADLRSARRRAEVCPRIAYMPQGLGRNLYPTLSVRENVDFFARLFGYGKAERRRRSRELLGVTGLAPFAGRPANQLSGGMRQKLGLCCALVHDPDLLILDEPTTGVDPLSRRQFWEFIERIRERHAGLSVLVSTAYMDEAARFDWLMAMDAGRLLATGTPAELLARTGAASLEEAFIALLPEEKRRGHRAIAVPPRPATGGGPPAIEAERLTRRFGSFTAVDAVSYRIERGEIFGFVGSNGCGKTTTMKMLVGLLPATGGEARLFGAPVDARRLETRRRIGYMSQSFSLYAELTVRQNLDLHARLFALPAAEIPARVAEAAAAFGLTEALDELAERLPLGIRQRLSLAVAVIHRPEVLILDEPTSGVDPVGRDRFWELLIDLSRRQGVTIFVSTHFMNEAARCDRLALMHAGRLLACDTPAALCAAHGGADLEQVFVAELQRAGFAAGPPALPEAPVAAAEARAEREAIFSPARLCAYALRETREILRDPIRLAFALLGPALLMLVFGYGITFDVERLAYAALDRDQSPSSRTYLENFSGSRYFTEQPALADQAALENGLRSARLRLAIEIPPDFGRDLHQGRSPEVGLWIDGAMPFRGETMRGYAQQLHQLALGDPAFRARHGGAPGLPATIDMRFRYNQAFRSVYAMVPSVIAVLLVFIPAVATAVGVVREKELGSITNLYATPVTRLEFLLGKQAPYVAIAMLNFFTLAAMALLIFQVPLKAGWAALTLGALLYVIATTGLGLVISAFARTQIAALFATSILTVMPVVQFCGMMAPVSSLSGFGAWVGTFYPTTYFMTISVGAFTKALGFAELAPDLLRLALFIPAITLAGVLLLRTQEA